MPNHGMILFFQMAAQEWASWPRFFIWFGSAQCLCRVSFGYTFNLLFFCFGVWRYFSPKIVCHPKMNSITKKVILRFEPILIGGINTTDVSPHKFNRIDDQCMAEVPISRSTLIKYFNFNNEDKSGNNLWQDEGKYHKSTSKYSDCFAH